MITLTIVEQVKDKATKTISPKRYLKLYHSADKASQTIKPIVAEMRLAKRQKRIPSIRIDAVSYDTKSEKTLLLELGAITSIENESDDQY